ncbi:IS66 family transposase [Paenibacillus sp. URB8-2]|uniref:IS66 family transposase n=1 Tax=Paenibacillus sp. URB8-2 TaxID=2741301 RepID=UPI0015BC9FD3|nr:transposase [Paenibacillus sp. URB8-2]BCG61256.1 hypothetical protein PUR_46810 [Paenibacillus sp. URB8-2]
MAANYERGLYKEYERLLTENEALKAERVTLPNESRLLQKEIQLRERLEAELTEKMAENEALKKEILRLSGMLNLDGTNSGVSTARTPLSEKKVIPNSRTKSGKPIGGQPGHAKNKLHAFAEEKVTETNVHRPKACSSCGGQVEDTGKVIDKDELDYGVVVIKRRHRFPVCRCADCGHEFHLPIPASLKEENQYGSRVQALGLSLMNIGNMSVNKVRKMIYGLSEEEIHPSEGYLMKQQRKAAGELQPFINGLKKKCLTLGTVYWDDTVIDINKCRGCLRFYGNEQIALYTAHLHKNKEGLDDDGILKLLPAETIVMHDHNKVNYNKAYSFSNIECNVHLLRDLQKTTDNLPHSWSSELKTLLEKTNTDRKAAMERGESAFDDADVRTFFLTFDRIMLS